MHNYANLCKSMHPSDPILFSSLHLNIRKVHVKFHLDLVSSFQKKLYRKRKTVENRYIMHNYVCKIMYVTDSYLVQYTANYHEEGVFKISAKSLH